ncbi:unnamed protein product [Rhodiola kirilowii]
MDLVGGYRARNGMKRVMIGGGGEDTGLDESRAVLVIKVSDSRVLQIVARSLFLAIVIVTLPMIMPTIRAVSRVTEFELNQGTNGIHLEALPVVIHELADQGAFEGWR